MEASDDLEALVDRLRRRHGWAEHVTLEGCLGTWADLVEEVEAGYPHLLEEYWNDVSVREILDVVLEAARAGAGAELRERLRPWDQRFLAATVDPPVIDHGFDGPWERRLPRLLVGEMLRTYESIGGPIPPEVERRA